jgi:hypothetical protein
MGLKSCHSLALVLLVSLLVSSRAMDSNKEIKPMNGFQSMPQMLEISTRPWLYSLSLKYKANLTKLSDIPDAELDTIKKRVIYISFSV